MAIYPTDIDLERAKALTITWSDGRVSTYPVAFLRRNSPSADARQFREELAKNPLTVLPSGAGSGGPLRAESVEMVGNYAIRLVFSDGHDTGLYTWAYLRSIDPAVDGGGAG
ncbi:MAG: gamma-butyrobetaine hydroxylase-like domain-containing protein [Phycisphaerales bacterium JB063]